MKIIILTMLVSSMGLHAAHKDDRCPLKIVGQTPQQVREQEAEERYYKYSSPAGRTANETQQAQAAQPVFVGQAVRPSGVTTPVYDRETEARIQHARQTLYLTHSHR